MSALLKSQDVNHVVLEYGDIADSWRARWDSLQTVTPNWTLAFPGKDYEGPAPEAFMKRDDLVKYLEDYVTDFNLPVRRQHRVEYVGLNTAERRFEIDAWKTNETNGADELVSLSAEDVVVCTGPVGSPRLPDFASTLEYVLPEVNQLHSSQYKNAEQLEAGSVLVVGSSQSGTEIAQDLLDSGRKVYIATGANSRMPRRYRGKDVVDWLNRMGVFATADYDLRQNGSTLVEQRNSQMSSARLIDLRDLQKQGAVLLGRMKGSPHDSTQLQFEGDLDENVNNGEVGLCYLLQQIDTIIENNGWEADDVGPEVYEHFESETPPPLSLCPKANAITTIIWATGYEAPKFPFLNSLADEEDDLYDEHGYPNTFLGIHRSLPGLQFTGLNWLSRKGSPLFLGAGHDAAFVTEYILHKQGHYPRDYTMSKDEWNQERKDFLSHWQRMQVLQGANIDPDDTEEDEAVLELQPARMRKRGTKSHKNGETKVAAALRLAAKHKASTRPPEHAHRKRHKDTWNSKEVQDRDAKSKPERWATRGRKTPRQGGWKDSVIEEV